MKRHSLRRGLSLLEALVAVVILAILSGPLITNMMFSRRSVVTSSRDLKAVLRAGAVLELVQSVSFTRLPVVAGGVTSELEQGRLGLGRASWPTAMPPAADQVDLGALIPEAAVQDFRTYLWIEELSADPTTGEFRAKDIRVVVEYPQVGTQGHTSRYYELRTMIVAEGTP